MKIYQLQTTLAFGKHKGKKIQEINPNFDIAFIPTFLYELFIFKYGNIDYETSQTYFLYFVQIKNLTLLN